MRIASPGGSCCYLYQEGDPHAHCTAVSPDPLPTATPFANGVGTWDWNGEGYLLRRPYVDVAETTLEDEPWVNRPGPAQTAPIPGPREYRHTLGTVLNGLIELDFVLLHLSDRRDFCPDPDAPPGTWDHFTAYVPPWLAV